LIANVLLPIELNIADGSSLSSDFFMRVNPFGTKGRMNASVNPDITRRNVSQGVVRGPTVPAVREDKRSSKADDLNQNGQ
jgi:hypothetical protein